MNQDDVAVVLIGHGSKLPGQKEVVEELGQKIEQLGMFKAVRVAFMQINSPSIEEVLRALAEEGIKNIVAAPVFLAEGAHTQEDIPEKLRVAFEGSWAELGQDLNIKYGKPFGADDRIVALLLDQIREAMKPS